MRYELLKVLRIYIKKTFFEPGYFWTSSFEKNGGTVTFCLYDFFQNDMDIQLILNSNTVLKNII